MTGNADKIKTEWGEGIELAGDAQYFIQVPQVVIESPDMGKYRLSAYCFAYMKRGLDNTLNFSVNDVLKWSNRAPSRSKGGVSDAMAESFLGLEEYGFVSLLGTVSGATRCDAVFEKESVNNQCDRFRFAIVHLDDIKKIFDLDITPSAKEDALLVYAYLKMMIVQRPNKLKCDEIGVGGTHETDVDARRKSCPEAYDCYHSEIADSLGMTEGSALRAATLLEEMEIIYREALPREKVEGEWRTSHTIFCMTRKREKGKLFVSGRSYYMREVANKKERLASLTKRKRAIA